MINFLNPTGRKVPVIWSVTCFLYSLHLYWYVVLQSFFSTHSSLHSYLYVQPFLLNLSFGHSSFLSDLPSLYKSSVRGVFKDINMRWWEVMERSWCHDWVTSPCFLQWQFLSLVVRRLWGMSGPAASHTPSLSTPSSPPMGLLQFLECIYVGCRNFGEQFNTKNIARVSWR